MNITQIIIFPLKVLVIVIEAFTKGICEYLENCENPMFGDDYVEMMY
jgi:hypothetical protein